MAAEVIANKIGLDLYRIDLASVVNKYIGETEKNLKRVFDAAEISDMVLFFDEADSLFGKRTEVSDSRDRYANLEVSYLLERMERYKGLAVLATNLGHNIDPAFQRRMDFVIDFPMPDLASRHAMWDLHLPAAVLGADVDTATLARMYPVPGGWIRNAAIAAAFLAAADGEPVGQGHVSAAVRREYDKAALAFPGDPPARVCPIREGRLKI